MKFIMSWTFKSEIRAAMRPLPVQKTGGQPPRREMLGRWTSADMSGGFDLLEGDDVKALAEFALMWSDLIDHRMVPVVEDAELAEVLGGWRSRPQISGFPTNPKV